MKNDQIFEIVQFEKLTNFQNLTILKIKIKSILPFGKWIFYIFEKLLNILNALIISKKLKINSEIKLSTNSSFVIFIFANFWNFKNSENSLIFQVGKF